MQRMFYWNAQQNSAKVVTQAGKQAACQQSLITQSVRLSNCRPVRQLLSNPKHKTPKRKSPWKTTLSWSCWCWFLKRCMQLYAQMEISYFQSYSYIVYVRVCVCIYVVQWKGFRKRFDACQLFQRDCGQIKRDIICKFKIIKNCYLHSTRPPFNLVSLLIMKLVYGQQSTLYNFNTLLNALLRPTSDNSQNVEVINSISSGTRVTHNSPSMHTHFGLPGVETTTQNSIRCHN